MKILELYFIILSKLYVKFSNGKEDWFYLPILILSFIIVSNIFIFSMLYWNINPFLIVGLVFILFFILIFLFSKRKYIDKNYVKLYRLNMKTKMILIFSILIDFYILFRILNYIREMKS